MNRLLLSVWIPFLCVVVFLGCGEEVVNRTESRVEAISSDADWIEYFRHVAVPLSTTELAGTHRVSLPSSLPTHSHAWVYQFGGVGTDPVDVLSANFSAWRGLSANLQCGPASVQILERLSGRRSASCSYRASVPGFSDAPRLHSDCAAVGVIRDALGHLQQDPNPRRDPGTALHGLSFSSFVGNNVSQVSDALTELGYTPQVFDAGHPMTLPALRHAIDANNPVILTVNTNAYARRMGYACAPAAGRSLVCAHVDGLCAHSHFVVVYGYSDNYVFFLDPGYKNGIMGYMTIDEFNLAIHCDPSGVEAVRPGYPGASSWFPAGTLLHASGVYYYVDHGPGGPLGVRHASADALANQRIPVQRAIEVNANVISCFPSLGELDPASRYREYRESSGTVWLVDIGRRMRRAFINMPAYLSWNGMDAWQTTSLSDHLWWMTYETGPLQRMQPGMLARVAGSTETWVVSVNSADNTVLHRIPAELLPVFGYTRLLEADRVFGGHTLAVFDDLAQLVASSGPEAIAFMRDDTRICLTSNVCGSGPCPDVLIGAGESNEDPGSGACSGSNCETTDEPDAGTPAPILTDSGSPFVDASIDLPDVSYTPCPTGFILCGAICINAWGDNANCGGCGRACGTGSSCSSGVCQFSTACVPPLASCFGRCADLRTDRRNCGRCGMNIGTYQDCVGGTSVPVASIPTEYVLCGSSRFDIQSDRFNCGSCGHACPIESECDHGICEADYYPCLPGRFIGCRCTDGRHGAMECGSNLRFGACVCTGS